MRLTARAQNITGRKNLRVIRLDKLKNSEKSVPQKFVQMPL
jgi:hypothetical protein